MDRRLGWGLGGIEERRVKNECQFLLIITRTESPESDRLVFQLCTFYVTMSMLLSSLIPGFLKCKWVNDSYSVVRVSWIMHVKCLAQCLVPSWQASNRWWWWWWGWLWGWQFSWSRVLQCCCFHLMRWEGDRVSNYPVTGRWCSGYVVQGLIWASLLPFDSRSFCPVAQCLGAAWSPLLPNHPKGWFAPALPVLPPNSSCSFYLALLQPGFGNTVHLNNSL